VRHVPPRALATFAFVDGPPKDAAAAVAQSRSLIHRFRQLLCDLGVTYCLDRAAFPHTSGGLNPALMVRYAVYYSANW
jgi:hypothetical protein